MDYYEIDYGKSITFRIEIMNNEDYIAYKNDYRVGIKVIEPEDGANYWELPLELPLGSDLSPRGSVTHTLTIANKKGPPISGDFKIRAYVKSLESGKEIDQSDCAVHTLLT